MLVVYICCLMVLGMRLFMYLPIILGYTSAVKFGLKPFTGLVIGAVLCYPALQASNISATGQVIYTLFQGSIFESNVYYEFLGIPIIAMNYTSTVLPVILIVYMGSKFQKLFSKFIPDVLKSFFLPMLVLLFSLVIGILVIGPIATFVSNAIGQGATNIYNFSPIIAGTIMGLFWQVLVIFGIHWGLIPIYINNIATNGFDQILMLVFATTFAQSAVVLAYIL